MAAADSDAAPLYDMATVTVSAEPEDLLSGSHTLDRSILDHLPTRNGSINEMLTILPGIQTSEFSRTSDNAGEILPPNLSISGGRFYENNFVVDGLGSNSLLDPAFDDKVNVDNVPGHSQELFLNPLFIDKVTVHRFNTPARYGSFTGGVVEAETIDPAATFGGEVYLRHTRDEWTELHYDGDRQAEFDLPRSGNVQPKFDKYDGGFRVNLPVTENHRLLLGYSQLHSKMPLMLIDQAENQYRTTENYLFKYTADFSPATRWEVTALSTPYEADLFLKDTLNSNYTLENKAQAYSSNLTRQFPWGEVEFDLGYRRSENNRQAPADYFIWRSRLGNGTPLSKPWGATVESNFSWEGGYGDIEKQQSSTSAALHVTGKALKTGPLQHTLAAGVSFETVEGSFDRVGEMTRYTASTLSNRVACPSGAIDCIPGEQFMIFKNVYPADDAEAVIRFYDTYLEDSLQWGQLTLRPGVRLSYDDQQHNDNWAPRLAVSYDLFGDSRTVLTGGLNRYYGKTLLSQALSEKKAAFTTWTRSPVLQPGTFLPQPWVIRPRASISSGRLADLETPYSDEWVVGLRQELFGGTLELDYLERNSEQELTTTSIKDGIYTYTEWTNDGNSQHRGAALSWERSWHNHAVLLTATWQETETGNSTYLQRVDLPDANGDGLMDPVWYDGNLVERDELPRPDFNREWTAAVTYVGRLPGNFTFTNVTRYRSPYTALENTGEDHVILGPDNKTVVQRYDIYDDIKQSSSLIFDWRLDWERKLWREQLLVLTLEVNNVFDKKVRSGESIDVYDLGRQFWLGMSYRF